MVEKVVKEYSIEHLTLLDMLMGWEKVNTGNAHALHNIEK